MLKIILLMLFLLIMIIYKSEHFIVLGLPLFKPSIKVTNYKPNIINADLNDMKYLNIISKINGYKYYVGGGLANSYYSYGYKPSEISKFVNINDYKFEFNQKTQKYDKFITINKNKLIPLLSLAVKEINQSIINNIDNFNDIQNRMFKIDEKIKKKITKKHLG